MRGVTTTNRRDYTHIVFCPGNGEDDCGAEVEVTYYPGFKGRTYGPPEQCEEGYGPGIDAPDECSECGTKFTGKVIDDWILYIEGNDE